MKSVSSVWKGAVSVAPSSPWDKSSGSPFQEEPSPVLCVALRLSLPSGPLGELSAELSEQGGDQARGRKGNRERGWPSGISATNLGAIESGLHRLEELSSKGMNMPQRFIRWGCADCHPPKLLFRSQSLWFKCRKCRDILQVLFKPLLPPTAFAPPPPFSNRQQDTSRTTGKHAQMLCLNIFPVNDLLPASFSLKVPAERLECISVATQNFYPQATLELLTMGRSYQGDITRSEMAHLQTKAWSCQHAERERESMLTMAASVYPMLTGNHGMRVSLSIGIFPTK